VYLLSCAHELACLSRTTECKALQDHAPAQPISSPSPSSTLPVSLPRSRSTTLQHGIDPAGKQDSSDAASSSAQLRTSVVLAAAHAGPFSDTKTHAPSPGRIGKDLAPSSVQQHSGTRLVSSEFRQQQVAQQGEHPRQDAANTNRPTASQQHLPQPHRRVQQIKAHSPSGKDSSAMQCLKLQLHAQVSGHAAEAHPQCSPSLQHAGSRVGRMGSPHEAAPTLLSASTGPSLGKSLRATSATEKSSHNPACQIDPGQSETCVSTEKPRVCSLNLTDGCANEADTRSTTSARPTICNQESHAAASKEGNMAPVVASSTPKPVASTGCTVEASSHLAPSTHGQEPSSHSPSSIPRAAKSPSAADASPTQACEASHNDENRAQTAHASATISKLPSRLPSPRALGPEKGSPELPSPPRGDASRGDPPRFPFESKSPLVDPTSVPAAAPAFLTQGASESESDHDVRTILFVLALRAQILRCFLIVIYDLLDFALRCDAENQKNVVDLPNVTNVALLGFEDIKYKSV
jgi:hypothetical protein